MRLASYERDGAWRAAVASGDGLLDAEALAARAGIDPVAARTVKGLLAAGPDTLRKLEDAAQQAPEEDRIPLGDVRLGAPVPDAGKVLCIGLNYHAHAGEAALEEPEVPIIFAKWENALVGPGRAIELPAAYPDAVDYEGELAVVIGRTARDVAEADALDAVAGWMPFHDVSARDLQTVTSQWTAGKACDTFAPCGPFLMLDDGLERDDLRIETRVNGELRQSAVSSEMIFGVPRLVSWISSFMTLQPGDIIATGTPEGVGGHRSPPLYLAAGDRVTITVGGEVLENPVAAASA